MLDRQARALLAPPLDAAGRFLSDRGVPATVVTAGGFGLGAAACATAALRIWPVALALWLANRIADGLDGPIARAKASTELGGFLDIVSDFAIYGGFVVGVAVAVPPARLACTVLLATYYLSGTAFLALSSLLERRASHGGPGHSPREHEGRAAGDGRSLSGDGRSLHFVGGIAEGTETIVVYGLFCLFPRLAEPIAWGFSVAVAVTAIQRIVIGVRLLRPPERRCLLVAGRTEDRTSESVRSTDLGRELRHG